MSDHAKYVPDYLKMGVRVVAPTQYWDKNVTEWWWQYGERVDETRKPFKIGGFTVKAFPLEHDGVPCYGFYIKHKELGKLLYITDTEYVRWNFSKSGINHIMVEANYSKEIINRESPNYDHVTKGHMELKTTLDFLHTNDNQNLMNVVLLHLSDANSNSELFKNHTIEVLPYANVYVAEKGLEIELNTEPF